MKKLSSKSQCQLSARTKRTNPIYQRIVYQLVCSDWIGPCNTTFSISYAYSKQGIITYLQLYCLPPLLPNTTFRSTAVVALVPQDPDASAKPNVPVRHEQRNSNEGEESNQRGRLGGGSTKQVYLNTKGPGSKCDLWFIG